MVFKQNLTPPIGVSRALKIVKNGRELKKLWPPKIKGVKMFKNQTTKYYKGQFPNN
jgi:hypothetical protein